MNDLNKNISGEFVLPVYCSQLAYNRCLNTPLINCRHCSIASAFFLLFFLTVLAIAVIVANALVIASVIGTKSERRRKMDYVKSSLALADILGGLDALLVGVRLGGSYLRYTVVELEVIERLSRGTLESSFAGVLFFLSYTLTAYHLLYMSIQRLVAVRFPFRYRNLQPKSVVVHMVVLWCWSILWSWSPVYLYNGTFQFSMNVAIFRYFPSFSSPQQTSDFFVTQIIPTLFLYFIPYLFMMFITPAAALFAWKGRQKSYSMRSSSAYSQHDVRQSEIHLMKITILIQIGFTVAIVPTTVEYYFAYRGVISPTDHPVAFTVCYFLFVATGLLNVFLYSMYDDKFKESISSYSTTLRGRLTRTVPRPNQQHEAQVE